MFRNGAILLPSDTLIKTIDYHRIRISMKIHTCESQYLAKTVSINLAAPETCVKIVSLLRQIHNYTFIRHTQSGMRGYGAGTASKNNVLDKIDFRN